MRIPPRTGSSLSSDPNDDVDTVKQCPFCASTRVTTTNKALSLSTYWRCHGCGEIWNPGRSAIAARYQRPRW
jgi:transposase-like protein